MARLVDYMKGFRPGMLDMMSEILSSLSQEGNRQVTFVFQMDDWVEAG